MWVSFGARLAVLLACISCFNLVAQDQPQLNFADQVQLLDCQPVTTIPCFTASFNIVDAKGVPYPVHLPATDQLRSNLTITADGAPVQVFYVSAGASRKLIRGRLALVLVDISGSMARKLASGETRFEAAKSALNQFLGSFQDGVDEVAIVPFESHYVASTIRAASFAHTQQDALAQVAAIPAPQGQNNTALFSAVSLGLDVLADHIRGLKTSGNSPETMLIVMTDGTNEILKGDDPGLLAGEEGLDQVAQKIAASRIPVTGIGFGDKDEVDVFALERLTGKKPYMANDAERLGQVFQFARKLLVDRIEVAFLSPWPDRAYLEGKTISFDASLLLTDGVRLGSNEAVLETPRIGFPLFSGKASVDMLALLNEQMTKDQVNSGWLTLLRPVFVFLGLGGLILIAWFWIPRLVWPGQYIGSLAFAKPAGKWAVPSRGRQRPMPTTPKNAPPGFETGRSGPPPRTPQDVTVVQPASEGTKTRLHHDFRR
jgi:hypothetical protein